MLRSSWSGGEAAVCKGGERGGADSIIYCTQYAKLFPELWL